MRHLKLLPAPDVQWDAVFQDPFVVAKRVEDLIARSNDSDPARAAFFARLACRLILRHGLKLVIPR